MTTLRLRLPSLLAASLLAGCGGGGEAAPPATSAPEAVAPPQSSASAPAASSSASAPVEAAPVESAAPSASAAAEAAPEAPLPEVEVKNIGMHIGGGPNDAPTKAPIKRSVEPHFDAFRRCWAEVEEPTTGDVSVDLRIEREGGLAKLTKYKSALRGERFEACVRDVFAKIEFERPKTGATVVSYSLRFSPKKR